MDEREQQVMAIGAVRREPWLDAWGNNLPHDELKLVTCTWDHATWERYLKSLENPLKESVGYSIDAGLAVQTFESRRDSAISVESRRNEMPGSADYYEQSEEEYPENNRWEGIVLALGRLTTAEYSVIIKYFWEGLSEYGIARVLRVTRSTVQVLKRRAIDSLREYLSSNFPRYSEMRRQPREKLMATPQVRFVPTSVATI